jgi:hypothetical protein
MRIIIRYFVFALVLISWKSFSQPLAKIGLSLDSVKKICPHAAESKYQNTIILTLNETIHGLSDSWTFNFEKDTLRSMMFHKYIPELSEANFNKCLKATKEIIKDYTEWFGEPDEEITGTMKYIDPHKKLHYGYDVLEARWKNVGGQKMKVEFTFMGGKGQYNLLVVLTHFDKDYPYYE